MKKYLFMIVSMFTFILFGVSNVDAASPLEFLATNHVPITEIDLGSVLYNTNEYLSIRVKNPSSSDITITNADIESSNFNYAFLGSTTIPAGGNIVIQVNNIRGMNASSTPYTSELVLTDDSGKEASIPIKVIVDKGIWGSPSYFQEHAKGTKLSSIHLSNGWVWSNPDDILLEGNNNYEISYVDTTGNYKSETRMIEVIGKVTYDVTFDRDNTSWSIPDSDYTILEGYSSSLTIYARVGYLLTSITINGIEQLTDKVSEQFFDLRDVRENFDIKVETERIVYEPIPDAVTNEIIVPKFEIGSDENVEFKFDYDYSKFFANEVFINGIAIKYSLIDKYFTFTEGSVVVTVSNEYLKTLDAGTYDLEIVSYNRELLKATFTVDHVKEEVNEPETANPETSDNIGLYIVLLVASFGTIIFINRKKSVIR